jgi:hypothetical protein
MDSGQARSIAKLFASRFIARPNVMAVQTTDGEYRPTRDVRTKEIKEGFSMSAILGHLGKERTLGHYMVAEDNSVKLFALDVDLEQTGTLPTFKFGPNYADWQPCNPRERWMSRAPGVGRDITKLQMRLIGHKLARTVHEELGINVAVAYSGSKGIHVYGFTGPTTAERARKGAKIVLEAAGWELARGNNFFAYRQDQDDPLMSMANFSVEVYPKQDDIDGKDLGNLMRLPLGVNLKSPRDVPFFVDLRSAMSELRPMDPIEALTTDNPWRHEGE